jgi:hypothetical protein
MALVNAVRVIEAEYAAFVHSGKVGQQKGKVILNDLTFIVDPNLFAKNTDSTGTPKPGLVVGFLAKIAPSTHSEIILQMMRKKHHLYPSPSAPLALQRRSSSSSIEPPIFIVERPERQA